MIYEFNGYRPVVHRSSFVHPQACVTGNVIIGREAYIGPGAAIRGDWGEIHIHDGCNVQENCTIHMFPGVTVVLDENSHIGHGAVIHGAHIGKDVLVGMNAVIMDRADIGEGSIIGALCFVPEDMIIPAGMLVVGAPAKILKEVSAGMKEWKKKGTAIYRELPRDLFTTLKPCEPLRTAPKFRRKQEGFYKTWKQGRE